MSAIVRWFVSLFLSRRNKAQAPDPNRFRPVLRTLEGREAPSVLLPRIPFEMGQVQIIVSNDDFSGPASNRT